MSSRELPGEQDSSELTSVRMIASTPLSPSLKISTPPSYTSTRNSSQRSRVAKESSADGGLTVRVASSHSFRSRSTPTTRERCSSFSSGLRRGTLLRTASFSLRDCCCCLFSPRVTPVSDPVVPSSATSSGASGYSSGKLSLCHAGWTRIDSTAPLPHPRSATVRTFSARSCCTQAVLRASHSGGKKCGWPPGCKR